MYIQFGQNKYNVDEKPPGAGHDLGQGSELGNPFVNFYRLSKKAALNSPAASV